MKKVVVGGFLFAVLLSASMAQDYQMYETMYLKVHPGKYSDLSERLAAHNKKFHAQGAYTAAVWSVVTGPHSGKLLWAMGPCTFTDLDHRPRGDEHTTDWNDTVLAYADAETNEYWRLVEGLSYVPDNDSHKIIRVRVFDIKNGEGYRFRTLLQKMKEVREKKNYSSRVNVYRNRFWGQAGREWVTVTSYDKWADLDRENTFVADYKEVHGENSWVQFLEEWEDVVEGAEDELRELLPELGGSN